MLPGTGILVVCLTLTILGSQSDAVRVMAPRVENEEVVVERDNGHRLLQDDEEDSSACIGNSTFLDEAIIESNVFIKNLFTLCPNTTFRLGFPDSDGRCCVDGGTTINLRPNTEIRCGETGSSENNCVFLSGQIQFLAAFGIFDGDRDATNVILRGITFESSGNIAVLLSNAGDYLFQDCIFRAHEGAGTVLVQYSPPRYARRQLLTQGQEQQQVQHENEQQRYLQTSTERVVVTFDGCMFTGNRVGLSSPGAPRLSLIHSMTGNSDVIIKNCTFSNNKFHDGSRGHAIELQSGASLTIEDTCFVGNDFASDGVIVLSDGVSLSAQNNHVTEDEDVLCPFIAVRANDTSCECIHYDLATCGGEPLDQAAIANMNWADSCIVDEDGDEDGDGGEGEDEDEDEQPDTSSASSLSSSACRGFLLLVVVGLTSLSGCF